MGSMLRDILQETVMLVSVFVAAFIVLGARKIPFNRIGLSLRGKDLLFGMLFAVALYAVGFGASLLTGAVEVAGIQFHLPSLLMSFLFFVLVAVMEEVAMRGFVLGRLLDGGMNKFVALVVSSVLFSLMHLFNPNFAFVPFLNIVLAGLLLGASYIYTRNLSFPIALHLFWNWLQGPILGFEVSGTQFSEGVLMLHLPEANLLNGGAFGFEGSIICSVLLIAGTASIILFHSNHR